MRCCTTRSAGELSAYGQGQRAHHWWNSWRIWKLCRGFHWGVHVDCRHGISNRCAVTWLVPPWCWEVQSLSSASPLPLLPVPVLWSDEELTVTNTAQENIGCAGGEGEAIWAFLGVLSLLTLSWTRLTVPIRWQNETPPPFLPPCWAEFQSRLGERGSEVRANLPHLARLGHLTLLPFLARKSLSLRLSSVLIIHFCFGSKQIFMDSNPEACAASFGEAGVTYIGLHLSPSFS